MIWAPLRRRGYRDWEDPARAVVSLVTFLFVVTGFVYTFFRGAEGVSTYVDALYFTVAAKADDDPLAQWQVAKTAASDAMIEAGATITHHHAVGTDHKPWLAREIGPVGVQALRAVKDSLDPTGILNPGVLIP